MAMIMHVDMDAFYASIEQRDHPALRGKPVVVGGPPTARGVVQAASYEARKFGVHSAMPSAQAVQLCPQAVFLRADFEKYTRESRRIMAILKDFSPLVEPLSLDEAFLDITGTEGLFGPPEKMARTIKDRIFQETNLIASVGVGPSKFIAKLGSDHNKPDGLCIVAADGVQAFLNPLPVDRIPGIGKKMITKIQRLGIKTIKDLAAFPEKEMVRHFGSFGHWIHELAQGRDQRPVVPEREEKSHGMERTFEKDTEDLEFLRKRLLEYAEDVAYALRSRGLRGRTVSIKVRFNTFKTITRSKTLELPTNAGPRIYAVARQLLEKVNIPRPVRLLGLSVSRLEDVRGSVQLEMFGEKPGEEEKDPRSKSIDAVRKKYGKKALRPGSLI